MKAEKSLADKIVRGISCPEPTSKLSTRALLRHASTCVGVRAKASSDGIHKQCDVSVLVRMCACFQSCPGVPSKPCPSKQSPLLLSRRVASAAQLVKRLLSNKYTVHSRHCCKHTCSRTHSRTRTTATTIAEQAVINCGVQYEQDTTIHATGLWGDMWRVQQGSGTRFVQTWHSHWSRIT